MRYRLILFDINNASLFNRFTNNDVEWVIEDESQIMIEFFDFIVVNICIGKLVEELVIHVQHPFRLVIRDILVSSGTLVMHVMVMATEPEGAIHVLQSFVATSNILPVHATSGDVIGNYTSDAARAEENIIYFGQV